MGAVINEWIINITAIAILGVMLDIVLPSGSMKKYSRFVIGIITIIIILNPVLQAFDCIPMLGRYIDEYSFSMDMNEINYQSQVFKQERNMQLEKLLTQKLEGQIEDQVKRLGGYRQVKARVVFEDRIDAESLVELKEIYINVSERVYGRVEPVEIEVSLNTSQNREDTESGVKYTQNELEYMREYLSGLYNVNPENIHIKSE